MGTLINQPPALTDRKQLARSRARVKRNALFLHDEVAAEIKDRLKEVNRRFTKPAIVTGFPEIWANFFPNATIVDDSDLLDLETGAFDLVINALTLHWANDPVGQLVQCKQALRPDGFFLGVMFGGQTLSGLRTAFAEAESALSSSLTPRMLPMGEIRDLGTLLQRAGFALPVADSARRNVTYQDAYALMRDLRMMGEGNALSQRARTPTSPALFKLAAQIYRSHNSVPDGRVEACFEMIYLSGWAPHESQQKPLKPGSAQMRLADALSVPDAAIAD